MGEPKEKAPTHKRRQPETSPLYQIVFHSLDEPEYVWESKCQYHYGYLRDEVAKTLKEYLNCGGIAHGAARVHCDGCKHSLLTTFSCKRRGGCARPVVDPVIAFGEGGNLTHWSFLLNSRAIFRKPMKASHDTTVGAPADDEVTVLKPLLQPTNEKATIVVSSVRVVRPRA